VRDDNETVDGLGRVASEEQVRAAVARLDHDDVAMARLAAAAALILQHHPRLTDATPKGLINEAVLRALDGRRRWHPEKIDFLGLIIGAMRSIASNATRVAATSSVQTDSIETLSVDDDEWVAASDCPSPSTEDLVIKREERALLEARLEEFQRELATDAEVSAVYDRLRRGTPKRVIRTALGMTDTRFWTVDRRLSRLIHRHFKSDGGAE
jgi:hypothetical protein